MDWRLYRWGKMTGKDGNVWDAVIVVTIEPSKELSRMLGSPYLIQKKFTLRELYRQGIVTEVEIEQMKKGETISKKLKVERG